MQIKTLFIVSVSDPFINSLADFFLSCLLLGQLFLKLLEVTRLHCLLVQLTVLVYLRTPFILKDAELIQKHRKSRIVLKVHQDFANADYLVFNLHNHFVIWRSFVSTFMVFSEQRDAWITRFFTLLSKQFLFVLIRQIELAIKDLNQRLSHLNQFEL